MDPEVTEPIAPPAAPVDDFVVASSGVPDAEPVESDVQDAPEAPVVASDRNADGTFKSKALDEAVKADAKPKARNNPVARMEEATAQAAAAKRERDEARAETARLKADLDAARRPVEAPKPAAKATAEAEPNPSDAAKYPNGEFDRQFLKDQARWEARQEFQQQEEARTRTAREQQQHQFRTQAEREWQTRLQAAKVKTPDWDVRFKPDTPVDTRIMPHLITQDDGPELLLYLSDHPDLAQRLVTLPPIAQIVELGKISGRLAAAHDRGTVTSPIPSKASAPITPLGGGASASYDEGSDDEPLEAFVKRENERERRRAR